MKSSKDFLFKKWSEYESSNLYGKLKQKGHFYLEREIGNRHFWKNVMRKECSEILTLTTYTKTQIHKEKLCVV